MQKDFTAVAWKEHEKALPLLSNELKESQALEEEEEDFHAKQSHGDTGDTVELEDTACTFDGGVACPLLRSMLAGMLLHLAWLFCRRTEAKAAKAKALKEKEKEMNETDENELSSEKPKAWTHSSFEVDDFGCTALHAAADCANQDEVHELLETMKMNQETSLLDFVNARDAWDETALHMAARRGSLSCCELLLQANADLNAQNADGKTPLQICGEAAEPFFVTKERAEQVTDPKTHEESTAEVSKNVSTGTSSGGLVPQFDDFEKLCHRFLDLGATLGESDALPRLCTIALAVRLVGEQKE